MRPWWFPLSVASAVVALTGDARADERPPGEGTRVYGELGFGLSSGTYTASRESSETQYGRGGINGEAIRLRAGVGYAIAPGLVVGTSAGLDFAFTSASEELCCGQIPGATGARLGLETTYYPDPKIGFRVLVGFGYVVSALRHDAEGSVRSGVLAPARLGGAYGTLGIARDYRVSSTLRVGGVLRVEVDALSGRNEDHTFTLRTFTPSFSLLVTSTGPK